MGLVFTATVTVRARGYGYGYVTVKETVMITVRAITWLRASIQDSSCER